MRPSGIAYGDLAHGNICNGTMGWSEGLEALCGSIYDVVGQGSVYDQDSAPRQQRGGIDTECCVDDSCSAQMFLCSMRVDSALAHVDMQAIHMYRTESRRTHVEVQEQIASVHLIDTDMKQSHAYTLSKSVTATNLYALLQHTDHCEAAIFGTVTFSNSRSMTIQLSMLLRRWIEQHYIDRSWT